MSEHQARARPVADAPIEIPIARADELAKRWASELVLMRPLAAIADIPLGELAGEAPGLCVRLLHSLASDDELRQLVVAGQPPARGEAEGAAPARLLAVVAAARDPQAAVEAVDALRGVLWREILVELRDPPARLVADLADRLAYVCARLLAATLGQGGESVRDARVGMAPSVDREQMHLGASRGAPGMRRAVLIDEHEATEPTPASAATRPARTRPSPPSRERPGATTGRLADGRAGYAAAPTARPLPWDTPPSAERRERPAPRAAVEQSPPSSGRFDGAEPAVRITRRRSSPVD